MNQHPEHVKLCYRCDKPQRMTREEFLRSGDEFTCCEVCRAILEIDASHIGQPIPKKNEDQN